MSFAQEIRDFTAAYTTVSDIGEKKKDRELREKQLNHDIEYENAMLALKQQELDQSAATARAKASGGSSSSDAPAETAATNPGMAIPAGKDGKPDPSIAVIDPSVTVTENRTDGDNDEDAAAVVEDATAAEEADEEEVLSEEEEAANAVAARIAGGQPVSSYAEGGLVEDPDLPFEDPPPKEAIPSSPRPMPNPRRGEAAPDAAAAPGAPTAPAKPEVKPADPAASSIVVKKSMEATEQALDAFEAQYSVPKTAVGGKEPRVDFVTGKGGMTYQEYEQIRKTVDENNMLPPRLISAAAQSEIYNYFLTKGQPGKAVEAAQGYLMAELSVNQTLGALAESALEKGKVAEACKIINDACSRFPNGHQIVVGPKADGLYVYEVYNPAGEMIESDEIASDGLMEHVLGLKDGTLYRKMLAQTVVAGRPKPPEEPEEGGWDLWPFNNGEEAPPERSNFVPPPQPVGAEEAIPTKNPLQGYAAPRGPGATPAGNPAPAAAVPAPAAGGLVPPPPEVLQAAKAAIAANKDPAAVVARLAEQGFSAEGL